MHAMKRGARATNIVLPVTMQCTATSTVGMHICSIYIHISIPEKWDTSSGNFRQREKRRKNQIWCLQSAGGSCQVLCTDGSVRGCAAQVEVDSNPGSHAFNAHTLSYIHSSNPGGGCCGSVEE
jgi:hypothetical protein